MPASKEVGQSLRSSTKQQPGLPVVSKMKAGALTHSPSHSAVYMLPVSVSATPSIPSTRVVPQSQPLVNPISPFETGLRLLHSCKKICFSATDLQCILKPNNIRAGSPHLPSIELQQQVRCKLPEMVVIEQRHLFDVIKETLETRSNSCSPVCKAVPMLLEHTSVLPAWVLTAHPFKDSLLPSCHMAQK